MKRIALTVAIWFILCPISIFAYSFSEFPIPDKYDIGSSAHVIFRDAYQGQGGIIYFLSSDVLITGFVYTQPPDDMYVVFNKGFRLLQLNENLQEWEYVSTPPNYTGLYAEGTMIIPILRIEVFCSDVELEFLDENGGYEGGYWGCTYNSYLPAVNWLRLLWEQQDYQTNNQIYFIGVLVGILLAGMFGGVVFGHK